MNGHFDIGGITPTRYFFSIAVVLGLLFALISGDEEGSLLLRLAQWQLQTVIPMALLIGAHMLLLNAGRFARLNPWVALAVSGGVGASLFVPLAFTIDLWLEPVADRPDLERELASEWLGVAPPVVLCWLALNAPWVLGYRLEKRASPAPRDEPAARREREPEFLSLVPPDRRGRVLMLKAELHYLQVVTDKGRALILYNLSDAIEQLPAALGMPVHRSYWVAEDAIERFDRQGRQGELILRDGQRVPVSRNRLREVSARLAAGA